MGLKLWGVLCLGCPCRRAWEEDATDIATQAAQTSSSLTDTVVDVTAPSSMATREERLRKELEEKRRAQLVRIGGDGAPCVCGVGR